MIDFTLITRVCLWYDVADNGVNSIPTAGGKWDIQCYVEAADAVDSQMKLGSYNELIVINITPRHVQILISNLFYRFGTQKSVIVRDKHVTLVACVFDLPQNLSADESC